MGILAAVVAMSAAEHPGGSPKAGSAMGPPTTPRPCPRRHFGLQNGEGVAVGDCHDLTFDRRAADRPSVEQDADDEGGLDREPTGGVRPRGGRVAVGSCQREE